MKNEKYVYWHWQLARCEEMETYTLIVEVQIIIIAVQVNLSSLLKRHILHDSVVLFLGIYPRETHTAEKIWWLLHYV